MIIAINVPKEHVDNAIGCARIGYWGSLKAYPGIVEEHHEETRWYAERGYRWYVGPEAPELAVPDYPTLVEE